MSPSLSTPLAVSVCVGGLAAAVKTFVRRVPLLARCLSPAGHEKAAKKGTAKHRNSLSIGQLERQSANKLPSSWVCLGTVRVGVEVSGADCWSRAGVVLARVSCKINARVFQLPAIPECILSHTHTHLSSLRFVCELSVNWLLRPNEHRTRHTPRMRNLINLVPGTG